MHSKQQRPGGRERRVRVRDALREGQDASLAQRRRIVALAAVGVVDFAIISLYQTGAVPRLPDLPLAWVDSNAVNAADEAYVLGIPDGTAGAVMYATTMMLAGAGGTRATGRPFLADALLAGAVAVGAATAAQYLVQMALRQKRACVYCLAGAAVSFAMLPPGWRVFRAAWRAR